MAACGSLQHLFEKPLPDNPTLLEALSSWNNNPIIVNPKTPIEQEQSSSFTELFGELHFKESYHHLISSSLSSQRKATKIVETALQSSHSYSLMNSERLQLCTEGLGFESSDDVDELKNDIDHNWPHLQGGGTRAGKVFSDEKNQNEEFRKVSRQGGGTFPPPISCIGKTGKPTVCFKSYRQHGRFVLKQVRIPSQEFLHACREDGRLKLQFVAPEDDGEEDDYGSEEEDLTEDDKQEEIVDTNREVKHV